MPVEGLILGQSHRYVWIMCVCAHVKSQCLREICCYYTLVRDWGLEVCVCLSVYVCVCECVCVCVCVCVRE